MPTGTKSPARSVASSRLGIQSASIARPAIRPDLNVCPGNSLQRNYENNSSLTMNWTASDTIAAAIRVLNFFFGVASRSYVSLTSSWLLDIQEYFFLSFYLFRNYFLFRQFFFLQKFTHSISAFLCNYLYLTLKKHRSGIV